MKCPSKASLLTLQVGSEFVMCEPTVGSAKHMANSIIFI